MPECNAFFWLFPQFGMFQTMTSGFTDEFKFLQTPKRKLMLTAALCFLEFLIGLICITQVELAYFSQEFVIHLSLTH